MNYLVILSSVFFLCGIRSHDVFRRFIFPWSRSEESKEQDTVVPGYKPILQVHKYNGIQINPINGGQPVYLESSAPILADQISGGSISEQQLQQIDLLTRVAPFLPDESQLQEFDFSSFLPYLEMISEDSLDRLRFTLESTSAKTKEKSKLIKFIEYLKFLKEKKLKPFKYVANVGSNLIHKKKETVQNAISFLYPTSPAPVINQPQYPFNQFLIPNRPGYSAIPAADQMQQSTTGAPVQPPRPETYYHLPSPQFQQFLFNQIGPHPASLFPSGFPENNIPSYTVAPPQNDVNVDWSKLIQNQVVGYNNAAALSANQQHYTSNMDTVSPSVPSKFNYFREEATPSPATSAQNYDSLQRLSGQQSWTNFDIPQRKEEQSHRQFQTPANTYLNTDLQSSASENVQKTSDSNANSVPSNSESDKVKSEETRSSLPNDFMTKPKPVRTILRSVTSKAPVIIYPDSNSEVKSKGMLLFVLIVNFY